QRTQRQDALASCIELPQGVPREKVMIDLTVFGKRRGNRRDNALPHALAHFTTPEKIPAGRLREDPARTASGTGKTGKRKPALGRRRVSAMAVPQMRPWQGPMP